MRRRYRKVLFTLLAVGGLWLGQLTYAPLSQALIVASVADDICAANVNPCVITQVVEVTNGAVLDFGTRTVRVSGSGQLDFGSSVGRLLCGRLEVSVGSSVGIRSRGSAGNSSGGVVTLQARYVCSGNASIPCLSDAVCVQAGAGTCSAGDGSILLDGRINGSADSPAAIFVTAAGPIQVSRPIEAVGSGQESDGGIVELESLMSSITLNSSIDVSSGVLGGGGDISLTAETDAVVTGSLDASGGDFDGGVIDIFAGGDIELTAAASVSAGGGEGSGGDLTLDAGGDVRLVGGSAGSRMVVSSTGAGPFEGSGGDGGAISIDADGDIVIGAFVRLEVAGGRPDGSADAIDVLSGGSVVVAGELTALGRGSEGAGGEVNLDALDTVDLMPSSLLDVSGSGGGAGDVDVLAGLAVFADGTVRVGASNGGLAGSVSMVSGGTMELRGTTNLQGVGLFSSGAVDLTACSVLVAAGASITNSVASAEQEITGRETVTVSAGASVVASGAGASNTVVFRSESKPPSVQGGVSPMAVLVLDRSLIPCPNCGDGSLEDGETCDDGNTNPGDGCSADCQDEGCIDATPGYPNTLLCDDGDVCTRDECDVSVHTCIHTVTCGGTTTTLPSGFCGDGNVDAGEECDMGSDNGRSGNSCAPGCTFRMCGDPNGSGSVTASDAFFILQVAVGTFICDDCLCDVQNLPGAKSVTASDALTALRKSVGLPVNLNCPACL